MIQFLKVGVHFSNDDELKVYREFSTCNIQNKEEGDKELNTEEFKHDKKKRYLNIKILG